MSKLILAWARNGYRRHLAAANAVLPLALIILLSGILVYYGVAGSGRAVFVRYMMPLIPLLCLAAALWLAHATRRWKAVQVGALAAILIAPAAHASWRHDLLLARVAVTPTASTRFRLASPTVGMPAASMAR